MVSENPKTLLDGLAYRGAITDSVINKKLWISKNMEFTTIFKLDRMARSVARAGKAKIRADILTFHRFRQYKIAETESIRVY